MKRLLQSIGRATQSFNYAVQFTILRLVQIRTNSVCGRNIDKN